MTYMFTDLGSEITVNVTARHGSLEQLKGLLRQGKAVDICDNRGWQPLHEAAAGNHHDCLLELLTHGGVDIDWASHQDGTALHVAVMYDAVECVAELLRHKADPNISDFVNTTPLITASKKGSAELVSLLLYAEPQLDLKDYSGDTALHYAASRGHEDIVEQLVQAGCDVTVQNSYEITPVFDAANKGHAGCLRIMLDGADRADQGHVVNLPAVDGGTPLYLAAQEGHMACVQCLVEHGARVNMTVSNPKLLPLHAALQANHTQIFKYLLERTDPRILPSCDLGIFNMAFEKDGTRFTRLLLKAGIDPNMIHPLEEGFFFPHLLYGSFGLDYSHSMTPLAFVGHVHCNSAHAEVLIQGGARVEPATSTEVPPLLTALAGRQEHLAKLLISHGASLDIYNPNVIGNLSIITSLQYWKGLKLLLLCGAEVESLFQSKDKIIHSTSQDGDMPLSDFTTVYSIHSASGDNLSNTSRNSQSSNTFLTGHLGHLLPNTSQPSNHGDRPKSSAADFYTILSEAMLKRRLGASMQTYLQVVLRFARSVQLDERFAAHMRPDEYQQLREMAHQDTPAPLMHLCRITINKCLGPRRLLDQTSVQQLPLPPQIIDYVQYLDSFGT